MTKIRLKNPFVLMVYFKKKIKMASTLVPPVRIELTTSSLPMTADIEVALPFCILPKNPSHYLSSIYQFLTYPKNTFGFFYQQPTAREELV